jgi:hypothetical protein
MMRRTSLLAIAVLFLYGAPAYALTHVAPPGNAGVGEYQEDIPTAGGSVPVSKLSGAPTGVSGHPVLPHGVVVKLNRAGATGRAVAQFADRTAPSVLSVVRKSASVGRPSGSVASPSGHAPSSAPTSDGGQVAAAIVAGKGGGLGLLLPLLLAASLGAAAAAVILRRRRAR